MRQKIATMLCLLVGALLFCNCSTDRNSVREIKTIDITETATKHPFVTDGKIGQCKFVALETNENCLLGAFQAIEIKDSLIFILDGNNRLLVFNSEGKFQNEIGKIGNGPHEMLLPGFFFVNSEDKSVGVLDCLKSVLMKYAYDGTFIEEIYYEKGAFSRLTRMSYLKDGNLLLSMPNSPLSTNSFRVVNQQGEDVYKDVLPYMCVGNSSQQTSFRNAFTSNHDNTFLISVFSDTIYALEDGRATPSIIINRKDAKATTKEFLLGKGPYATVLGAFSVVLENGYSVGISQIAATDNTIYAHSLLSKPDGRDLFVNLTTGEAFIAPEGFNDYQEENIFVVFDRELLMATTSDAFVYVIPAHEAIRSQSGEHAIKGDARIDAVMKNLKLEDNPILGFYSIADKKQKLK